MNANKTIDTTFETISSTVNDPAGESFGGPSGGTANGTTATATANRTGTHRHRLVIAALGCVLAGSALGAAAVTAGTQLFSGGPAVADENGGSGAATLTLATGSDAGQTPSAADVYEQNVGAVVGVRAGELLAYRGHGVMATTTASGFVISEDGYILTTASTVAGSDTIEVTLADGTAYEAELVGTDADTNVAVLKIEAEGLQAVTVGDSDQTRVGENVYAIGNPLSEPPTTLETGIVSGLDRDASFAGMGGTDLLQTSISTGSSDVGGALFNEKGEVIGMTCGSLMRDGGLAVPINDAIDVARQLVETGTVAKPCIGVRVSDTPERLQAFGVPQGALVVGVVEGSPAETAGLQADDIVTAFNGEKVSDAEGLLDAIGDARVGDTVTLEVYRGGDTVEVEATVADQADLVDAGETDADDGADEGGADDADDATVSGTGSETGGEDSKK